MNVSLHDIQADIQRLAQQQTQNQAQHMQAQQLMQAQQIANLLNQVKELFLLLFLPNSLLFLFINELLFCFVARQRVAFPPITSSCPSVHVVLCALQT